MAFNVWLHIEEINSDRDALEPDVGLPEKVGEYPTLVVAQGVVANVMVLTRPTLNYVCADPDCAGTPTREGSAYWDREAQEWLLSDDMEDPYCSECSGIIVEARPRSP